MAPSATLAAVEEAAFNRLRKSGLRLLGCRYDVEVFEGVRKVAAAADGATSRHTAAEILAARSARGSIAPINASARSEGALWAGTRRALCHDQ